MTHSGRNDNFLLAKCKLLSAQVSPLLDIPIFWQYWEIFYYFITCL